MIVRADSSETAEARSSPGEHATTPEVDATTPELGTTTPAKFAVSLAERHIELAVTLADVCQRPPRWRGDLGADPATCAFFLIGAASVRWVEAAAAHPRVRAVDVSIEAMAVFAAIEASIATGRAQVVICAAGPGTVGALWGIPAARSQGATVLVLVPRTPPCLVGSVDIQEASYDQPSHTAGAGLFDEVLAMDDIAQLPRIALRLRRLFARPQGAVVRLCVPIDLLGHACPPSPDLSLVRIAAPAPSAGALARVAALLSGDGARPGLDGPPAFLFGSGAVVYRDRLGEVVDRFGGVHFATPPAAAIVEGSLGVISNAAYGEVPERLRALGVRCLVILGSRLGTASGGGAPLLPDGCPIVHVDVDPDVTAGNAVATWRHEVLHVEAEIGEFLDALELLAPRAPADAAAPDPKGA